MTIDRQSPGFHLEQLEDRIMLSTVEIFAAGSTGQENLELFINEQFTTTFSNVGGDVEQREFVRLTFETAEQLTPGDIGIGFANDAFDPSIGLDRNLVVDRIVVDGVTVQTEDPSTFSTGIYRDGLTGPGFFETEFFNINAIFSFADPQTIPGNDGDRIEFEALGTTGQEVVELVVRDETVASFNLNSAGDRQTFSFESNSSDLSIEDVRIEFVNDLFDPGAGIDRNVQIFEYRLIDDATGDVTEAQTTDGNVLSDGIFVPGVGITSGLGTGGFLAGNGFVQIESSGNPGGNPDGDSDALEILGVADGNFDGVVQGQNVDNFNDGGDFGAVVLKVNDGNNDVQTSNFGANSFQLISVGNKEVSAVFIDIRNAVFGDMVFDVDGTGGDTTAATFGIDNFGGTGGFFVGEGNSEQNSANLFFPGNDPIPDSSGLGSASSGGFRGLLIRFTDFDGFETVGFSGDGDPNSIAGFSQTEVGFGSAGFGNAITGGFDTGGQSGSELIGSSFTVLFADGTTATGFLGSDTTQAGAAGEAVQGREQRSPVVTVDTGLGVFNSTSNSNGQYGGSEPEISVTGQPGDVVRVTLHKGFNPVITSDGSPNSVADVIQSRLDSTQPEFPVNNAFDVQTVDVVIGANGTATLASGAFDYNNTSNGISFAGDNVQPIAVSAAIVVPATTDVIAGGFTESLVPLGAVSTPVYLLNPTQTPVSQ